MPQNQSGAALTCVLGKCGRIPWFFNLKEGMGWGGGAELSASVPH